MNANIRNALLAGFGAIVIGAGSSAWGGTITDLVKKAEDSGSKESSRSQPSRSSAPAPAPAPSRGGNAGRVRDAAPAPAPPPAAAPAPRSNDSGRDRGVIGGTLQRNFGTVDEGYDRDPDRGRPSQGRPPQGRPPHVVPVLPPGHRDYYWNGSRYYYHGGTWYQPYGGSYIVVGVPYGLFVGTLPGYYTSFWYGGTRYFYADDMYYTYEPARRGYVVAQSPYEDEQEGSSATGPDDDLFIYPAQGQSEQQQADDRYECHRWAAQQSGYDPIDDAYDRELRANYLRAMTACLTGRGYSVR